MAGCSARTFRCATARNYNREIPRCCRSHIVAIASATAAALDAARVTWWLDYGSLLGAVRNPLTTWADYPWLPQKGRDSSGPLPGIVPHDKDADWCFLMRDWQSVHRAMWVLAKRNGYDLVVRQHAGKIKIRLSRLNRTNLDLFGWHEVPKGKAVSHTRFDETVELGPGMLYRPQYIAVDRCKGKEFHRDMLLPLKRIAWEGMSLPAPADPEALLAHRYGDDWRTPIAANHDGVPR